MSEQVESRDGELSVAQRELGRDPLDVFHIGRSTIAGTQVHSEQHICARLADHRGVIDLPAFAVLFDHIGGIPFQLAGAHEGALAMQARLSLSALGTVALDTLLVCDASIVMADDVTGVTRVDIATEAGVIACTGLARNMRVGRAPVGEVDPGELARELSACVGAHGIVLPAPIPAEETGRAVVAAIASGQRSAGPLAELLGARVEQVGEGSVRLSVTTDPWMANFFGTMHGGMIATIVGVGVSFAGQLHAAAGRTYRVADLSVGFFRSPPTDGQEVIVEVEPVKTGRRVASFTARMVGGDGTLYCEGVADLHYS